MFYSFLKCIKSNIALKAISDKHKKKYKFGIPSALLSCNNVYVKNKSNKLSFNISVNLNR